MKCEIGIGGHAKHEVEDKVGYTVFVGTPEGIRLHKET
jgi:hypothetical protein